MSEIDEVKKILHNHEKRILDLEKLLKSKSIPTSVDGEKAVLDLINSGFFDTPKKFGEMIKELKIQAKFDKNYKYKEILAKFTRERKLGRKMVEHQWVYYKND